MTRSVKNMGLLVGVSTLALGMIAIASTPARAFDEVNWTWNALISENIIKDGYIHFDLQPTGMTMLEDLQVSIGDITATSTVHDISNNQPEGATAGGPVTVDLGALQFTGTYDTGGAVTGTTLCDVANPCALTSGTVNTANLGSGVTMNFDLGSIVVDQAPGAGDLTFDALTELPEVVSAATAVGNNTTINTDTAVQLYEAQWAVGDVTVPPVQENADGFTWSGVVGIQPANISATSTVYAILNASVDSSATAVGNNLSVDVEATGPDRLFIGNAIQVAVANVSATSDVSDVDLYNYTNLGALDRPIVNSVATAVGNNKSITVNAPSVNVTP